MPLNAVWYGCGLSAGADRPRQPQHEGLSDPLRVLGGCGNRGYIFASIDENHQQQHSKENDARGWFLLAHRAVRGFRSGRQSVRGKGPAAGGAHRVAGRGSGRTAAAFNRLAHYPDDANVKFDFGYGIRAIIAIAPVDGQYRPQDRLVPVRDVNYLVFHGSHDGDVTRFMGLRQYQRVHYTSPDSGFKAAVYVYRANHGQWNSVWGARDNGPRSARSLDLRGLLPAADQRMFAEVYISAFLDATLKGDARYLPVFRDHRTAADWLPKTMYFTRLQHASFRPLATFEEDIDVASGEPGVSAATAWRCGRRPA
jgi:hypothetical protein